MPGRLNAARISLMTNTSSVTVTFQMLQLFTYSHFHIIFQAKECNVMISKNIVEMPADKMLHFPNMKPHCWFPQIAVTEYHALVRTEIGSFVHLFVSCNVVRKGLTLYDGPSMWAKSIKIKC